MNNPKVVNSKKMKRTYGGTFITIILVIIAVACLPFMAIALLSLDDTPNLLGSDVTIPCSDLETVTGLSGRDSDTGCDVLFGEVWISWSSYMEYLEAR